MLSKSVKRVVGILTSIVGPLKTDTINGFSNYYRKFITTIPNQNRNDFSETIQDKFTERFPTLYDLI